MDLNPLNSTTNNDRHAPVPKYLIASFVVGLIVWAVYLAYGAATGGHNVWRGVAVLICFIFFLGWFWGLQRLYARRNRHE